MGAARANATLRRAYGRFTVWHRDNAQTTHQTDNANDLYELLAGREAMSLSGHTHTLEQLLPGESYAGWEDTVGVTEVPFHHIVGGAPSGSWYSGDLDWDGVPLSLGVCVSDQGDRRPVRSRKPRHAVRRRGADVGATLIVLPWPHRRAALPCSSSV